MLCKIQVDPVQLMWHANEVRLIDPQNLPTGSREFSVEILLDCFLPPMWKIHRSLRQTPNPSVDGDRDLLTTVFHKSVGPPPICVATAKNANPYAASEKIRQLAGPASKQAMIYRIYGPNSYASPSSPPEDDHFLIRTLGQLFSSYHFTHLLLVGAFNAPRAPWMELQCVGSSRPFTAALTEVVQQSAWTQHVVAPTRYRAGQQPSLLDLVITNERHFVDQVMTNAPLGHSDHCVLTFDFICYWARKPEPQTWIRNFCRTDFLGMRIFLDQVKLGPASVEDLYRTIVQKVHEADAMFVPKNQHAVG
ncbi:hypothetical protein CLF_113631 [Clonorchis sinensis]|uniref:Endonuclease/exonuclease/phosphatase domain-containing protein n=1 Tax=Clonorchis sinensis TaxID=79923 RepID=G7YYW8_CLOSI|nr:hypothetical protein CLF_113631 [Clonorchis sinensis]